MTERGINKQIGKPVKIDLRRPKAIGSAGFYLKSFKTKKKDLTLLKLDSRCNFEKRANGILLRANFSNILTEIPISKEDIISMTLKRGKENIEPFFLSPMWLLLKLGVSILYARYFRLRLHEYSIDQMELNINTTDYEMDFIANGYIFEEQLSFFKNLNYGNKLKIVMNSKT